MNQIKDLKQRIAECMKADDKQFYCWMTLREISKIKCNYLGNERKIYYVGKHMEDEIKYTCLKILK